MSGVIINGKQYERCNQCANWCLYQRLAYAPLNPTLPQPEWVVLQPEMANSKVDMCPDCMAGKSWVGKYRDPALNK